MPGWHHCRQVRPPDLDLRLRMGESGGKRVDLEQPHATAIMHEGPRVSSSPPNAARVVLFSAIGFYQSGSARFIRLAPFGVSLMKHQNKGVGGRHSRPPTPLDPILTRMK